MRPVKFTDFQQTTWGLGPGTLNVWSFENIRFSQSLDQTIYDGRISPGRFVIDLSHQNIWSKTGIYTIEQLWPEISNVLLDQGIICAPLENYDNNVDLPSLNGP